MLGTPNRGSHDIVEALLGTAATVQQLALLDLDARHRPRSSDIVAKFPGVLELLPDQERRTTSMRPTGGNTAHSATGRPSPTAGLACRGARDARQRSTRTLR